MRSSTTMPRIVSWLLLCHIVGVLCVSAAPTLFVPNHISSHMVLQQAPIHSVIWGFTTISTKIVSLYVDGSLVANSTPEPNGNFRLVLPPFGASTINYTLAITDGVTTITLTDVVFGDVFLCSGQSNMEFGVRPTIGGEAAINESGQFPFLRLYAATEQIATSPAWNSSTRFPDGSAWVRSAPLYVGGPDPLSMSLHYFSAACYYFGRDMYRRFGGRIPIGLVATPRGGSVVESWTSVEGLERCNTSSINRNATSLEISTNDPSALFNGSTSPYLPMRFKSVIFYQGESDSNDPTNYACRWPVMIHDWRRHFNDPDLPFVFVLLAAYVDQNFPPLRLAQMLALSLPRVYVASPIDLGDCCVVPWGTGHSRLKQPLGFRLMLAVIRHVYGDLNVVADGPALTSITWPSPSNMSIFISYNTSLSNNVGLHLKPTAFCAECCTINATNSLFQLVTAGDVYNATTIIIDNKVGVVQIVIDPSIISDTIIAVALENTGFPQCVLANNIDLPSLPWYITRTNDQRLASAS